MTATGLPRAVRGSFVGLDGDRVVLLSTWRSMHARCSNLRAHNYRYYGARGVTVCDRWKSFDAFALDMGVRPSASHSLDRIDPSGNYEPANCRWATLDVQLQNKRGGRRSAVVDDEIVPPRSRRDVLGLHTDSRAFLAGLDDMATEDDFCALLPVGVS